jgi:osmotically-inducible protein OsmY
MGPGISAETAGAIAGEAAKSRYSPGFAWAPCFPARRQDGIAQEDEMKSILTLAAVATLLVGVACTSNSADNASYKDSVKQALQQADLQDVTMGEDKDKNTITLGGKLHSEDARQQAGQVARAAAGNRTIANEISVQPVGAESEAKEIASDLDTSIEKIYKASLTAHGLEKQHIRFDAKNGVLTLKGSVKTPTERNRAEQLAQATPNVRQVLNQIDVSR